MLLAEWFLPSAPGDLKVGNALFFLSLLSLLTTLHDHYQPVHAYRARHEPTAWQAGSEGSGPGVATD